MSFEKSAPFYSSAFAITALEEISPALCGEIMTTITDKTKALAKIYLGSSLSE